MERFYSPDEAGQEIGVSSYTARRYFRKVDGVILLPSQNPYKTASTRITYRMQIPESVLLREKARLSSRTSTPQLPPPRTVQYIFPQQRQITGRTD